MLLTSSGLNIKAPSVLKMEAANSCETVRIYQPARSNIAEDSKLIMNGVRTSYPTR
jgi:hypothetical protein